MINLIKKNFLIIVIFLSIVVFYLNFYFREYLVSGSRDDFNNFVFFNIQQFRQDLIFSIKNYGLFNDAAWPLFYIIHAFLNPFSNEIENYLISTTLLGFLSFIILSLSITNMNFNKLQSFTLASMILLLPWFNGRAHWGTSANLGFFFLITSFYFYSKFKFLDLAKYQKLITLFLLCLFSSISLYIRPPYVFFSIFFIITYYISTKENITNKFYVSLFYLIFSIPGFYLLYIWGGIYDHKNSTVVSLNFHYSYILKNIPLILNYFFFYYWPVFIFQLYDERLKIKSKNYFFIFFIISFIFFILYLTKNLIYLSEFNLGGGVILKLGYLIGDKHNILFLSTAAIGGLILFNLIKEDFKNNFLVLFLICIFFGFSKYLYQDYLEPLIFLLLINGILNSKYILIFRKYFNRLALFYFIYFSLYNFSTILYYINKMNLP